MKRYKIIILVLVLLVGLILFLVNSSLFIIKDVQFVNYSVNTKEINEVKEGLFKNYFTINRIKVKNEFEKISYIKECKIKYIVPSELQIDLSYDDSIVLIKSGDTFYAYDGSFITLDLDTAILLKENKYYIELDENYVEYLKKYSSDENFEYLMQIMKSISIDYIDLITKIKYNSLYNSVKGSLIIELEDIYSTIEVRDNVTSSRIEDSIALVKNFYDEDPVARINQKNIDYILYSTALVKR